MFVCYKTSICLEDVVTSPVTVPRRSIAQTGRQSSYEDSTKKSVCVHNNALKYAFFFVTGKLHVLPSLTPSRYPLLLSSFYCHNPSVFASMTSWRHP